MGHVFRLFPIDSSRERGVGGHSRLLGGENLHAVPSEKVSGRRSEAVTAVQVEHPTTFPNFNLIWANPLNLPVAFLLIKKRIPWLARKYLLVYLCVLAAGFACWFLLTPAVLYSTLAVIAWMAYLSYRLQKL